MTPEECKKLKRGHAVRHNREGDEGKVVSATGYAVTVEWSTGRREGSRTTLSCDIISSLEYLPQLSQNDRVRVYQQWMTSKDLEGTARLIRYLGKHEIHEELTFERWSVRFVGNLGEPTVERWVWAGGKL